MGFPNNNNNKKKKKKIKRKIPMPTKYNKQRRLDSAIKQISYIASLLYPLVRLEILY
jgi:hypothetical protein